MARSPRKRKPACRADKHHANFYRQGACYLDKVEDRWNRYIDDVVIVGSAKEFAKRQAVAARIKSNCLRIQRAKEIEMLSNTSLKDLIK